ncbi:MAG: hypothetical protein ACRDMZ_15815 [Solirubrobacteraceae bacterium]
MFVERTPARNFALLFGLTFLSIAIIEAVVGGVSDGKLTGPGWIFAGGLPAAPDKGNALNALVIDRGLDVNQVLLLKAGLHNLIHFATGIVLLAAFVVGGAMAKLAAQVFGVVYVLVTLLGLVAPAFTINLVGYNLDGVPDLTVPIAYTIDHALIAVGGIYAGFLATR